jgi:hypothetical protein
MKTAPQMQRIIMKLAEQHGVDLTDNSAFLWLEKPDCAYR